MKPTKTFFSIAKNFGFLSCGAFLSRTFSLLFTILIARYLGPTIFGQYAFTLSLIALIMILNDLGINTLAIRDVADDRTQLSSYLSNIFTLKSFLILISTAIILCLAFFIHNIELRHALYILTAASIFGILTTSLRWCFQSFQKMEYEAILNFLEGFILFALGMFTIFVIQKSLIAICYAVLASKIIIFIICLFIVTKKFSFFTFKINIPFWKKILKASIPIGLSSIFVTLYLNTDILMISFFKGPDATAWYSASSRIIAILKILPTLFISAIFPIMSELNKSSKVSLENFLKKTIKYMTSLALPISFGTYIIAFKIVPLFYGANFTHSIPALQILIWGGCLSFLSGPFGYYLYVLNKQKSVMTITLIGFFINFILNLLLIPKYSYVGAALALVTAEFFVTLISWRLAQRDSSVQLFSFKDTFKILFATLIMSLVVVASSNMNIVVILFIAGVTYGMLLLITKVLSLEDVHTILNTVFKKTENKVGQ